MPFLEEGFRPEPRERLGKLLIAVKMPVGILSILVADIPGKVEMMIGVFK